MITEEKVEEEEEEDDDMGFGECSSKTGDKV